MAARTSSSLGTSDPSRMESNEVSDSYAGPVTRWPSRCDAPALATAVVRSDDDETAARPEAGAGPANAPPTAPACDADRVEGSDGPATAARPSPGVGIGPRRPMNPILGARVAT